MKDKDSHCSSSVQQIYINTIKIILDIHALINAHPPIWMPKFPIFLNNFNKKNYDIKYHVTVNLEIFARTLFSRNFAYAKFRENKTIAKWQNHSVVY